MVLCHHPRTSKYTFRANQVSSIIRLMNCQMINEGRNTYFVKSTFPFNPPILQHQRGLHVVNSIGKQRIRCYMEHHPTHRLGNHGADIVKDVKEHERKIRHQLYCNSACLTYPLNVSTETNSNSKPNASQAQPKEVNALDLIHELISRRNQRQREGVVTLHQRRLRLSTDTTLDPNDEEHDHDHDRDHDQHPEQTFQSTSKLASHFCELYLSLPPISSTDSFHLSMKAEEELAHEHDPTSIPKPKEHTVRTRIITLLAYECGTDDASIESTIRSYITKLNDDGNHGKGILSPKLIRGIRDACTPSYEGLFQLILAEADWKLGMKFIVEFRSDLLLYLNIIKNQMGTNNTEYYSSELFKCCKQMDSDLNELLSMWFSSGILELRRITYEHSSASVIEKIAMKEAVHPLQSLADLRNRLGHFRRCYAFFHPSLPDEPLVFIHVALLSEVASKMNIISDFSHPCSLHRTEDDASTAVFYSITATQKGLRGVDLGNLLIKRVVETLSTEFSSVDTFATLSPIPRFRKWLEHQITNNLAPPKSLPSSISILTVDEIEQLSTYFQCTQENVHLRLLSAIQERTISDDDTKIWYKDDSLQSILKPILMRLAAFYLVHEKYRGMPVDGVAKFHLRNGAQMYRLNWLADLSRKGMHNSLGIMVNYRYCLKDIEQNQFLFDREGRIPVKSGVIKWLE